MDGHVNFERKGCFQRFWTNLNEKVNKPSHALSTIRTAQRRFELANANGPSLRQVELYACGPFLVRTARTITANVLAMIFLNQNYFLKLGLAFLQCGLFAFCLFMH